MLISPLLNLLLTTFKMAIITLMNVTLTLLALYVGKKVYWEITTGARLGAMAKQHGSLPAKKRQIPFTFGAAFWWGQIKAIKAHRLLPYMAHSFKEVEAHTRHHVVLGTEWLLTQDPENVKAVLSTNFSDWSIGQQRIKEMSSFLGYGIFVNEGAEWKHSREMLRPCFEKKLVANTRVLERHTQRLFALLPQNGQTVDLQPFLHDLAMDIATDLLFGMSTNALCQDDENGHAVKDFCDAFNYASNPFERKAFKRWGVTSLFLPDIFNAEKKKHVKVMQGKYPSKTPRYRLTSVDFVDHIIAAQAYSSEKEQNKDQRYNLISALSESTQDPKRIRSETLNVLLAGRDTVASLLSNILWELPRHPSILTSLRNEIRDVCGTDLPTYEQLKSMQYLRAIVNESQRLYPIVPANNREALVDTFLPRGGGADGTAPVLVPKGSYVAWHLYSMQRRSDLFGVDADVFRPERWLEPGFRPGWAFVPFSGGPRVCIGQNMALFETMYVVVRFVQEFDLGRRDGEEWKEKLSITCIGLNGCKVGLTVREKV
jgi:cytochrome P450